MIKNKRISFLCAVLLLFVAKINGFTISESGEFTLGQDITESGTVITIAASDVIVNLSNYNVEGGTTGIAINSGLSNIVIKNGSIDGSDVGISVGSSCSEISITNITILNCGNRAIEVTGSSGSEVQGLSITRVKIEGCSTGLSADFVISFSFADEVFVQDVVITNNGGSSVALRTINIASCDKGYFNNVSIVCNEGSTLECIRCETVTEFLFFNCEVRVNTATGSLTGFKFVGSTSTTNNICSNCTVSENTSTIGPLAGFELLSFVIRNALLDCSADNNLVTGAVSTANCFGFNLDQPTFCSLVKCRAIHNQATGDGTSNICAGFNIGTSGVGTTGTKDSEFFLNQAVGNSGFNDARSFGLRVMSAAGGNVRNIFIQNLGNKNGPTTPVAANQITSDATSPGGVPLGSVTDLTITSLNFVQEYTNLRVIK